MDPILSLPTRPLPTPPTMPAGSGSARPGSGTAGIDRAANEFEAMVMGQMFELMWAEVPVDPVFGGGSGEEMFRGMLNQELGKTAAARGGLGIAALVRTELLRAQEAAQ